MTDYLRELFGLDGRVAVVTGGSSGIGRAIASALSGAGARVVVAARTQRALEETTADLAARGGTAAWVRADLGNAGDVAAAGDAFSAPFGEPDILVNCAGVNHRPPMPDTTTAQWDDTIMVNLTAPFLLGQRFGPAMAARGWGRIINVTSQQAHRAFGNSGAYGVSKGGLTSLTRSQSEAWARHGVTVNSLAPGFVLTALTAPVAADPERVAALAARTMIGRNAVPDDFCAAAVFLASPAAAYVTGQTLYVDGGFSST